MTSVAGTINVDVLATDNVAVVMVELFIDANYYGRSYLAPFTISLDTTTLTDGYHELTAKAYDSSGNQGVSSIFGITVDNSTGAGSDLSFKGQLRGTNAAAGELDWGSYDPTTITSGTDYLFISSTDVDYLHNKGMNFIRLIFSWEVMQPTLSGALSTSTYATKFWDIIHYITVTKGMYVMIEPHGASSPNFAHYKGDVVGTSPVTNSAFANFWSRIAGDVRMKDNPKTIIGLSNEPNFISGSKWWSAADAAVDAIRDAGFKNLVMIPGFAFTGSSTWTDSGTYGGDIDSPSRSNAYYAINFVDKLSTIDATNYPNGNFCFSTHQYFDDNGGGGATDIVDANIGVSRAQPIIDWCIANDKRCHISEFGARAAISGASTAVNNFLSYLDSNRDVCLGWAWWAYGPPAWGWSGYQFTMCPSSSYTVDSPQYSLISGYLPSP